MYNTIVIQYFHSSPTHLPSGTITLLSIVFIVYFILRLCVLFPKFHLWTKSFGVCLSLTDLFCLTLPSLAPPTSLQMARFHSFFMAEWYCKYHLLYKSNLLSRGHQWCIWQSTNQKFHQCRYRRGRLFVGWVRRAWYLPIKPRESGSLSSNPTFTSSQLCGFKHSHKFLTFISFFLFFFF